MGTLYRRYRPALFGELVGQETLARILTRSIETDRIAHAYIFSGPRGTGKTTVARILAKAINCLDRSSAEPCQKCSICLEIAANQTADIVEIDAASNRGIDDIRALRETVGFAPMRSTYKVYIIDEVHMLTKEAFPALLKTLEEPPAHAVFILATTELHKVPETIISRCLRLAFRLATSDQLTTLLKRVVSAEKLTVEPEAISLIAERANGSYRDSLTILASISGAGSVQPITALQVRQALGLPAEQLVVELYDCLLNGQVRVLAGRLKEIIVEGGQLPVILAGLIKRAQQELLEDEQPSRLKQEKIVTLLERLVVTEWRAKQALQPEPAVVAGLVGISLDNQSSVLADPSLDREPTVMAEPPVMRDIHPPGAEPSSSQKIDSPTIDVPEIVAEPDFWRQLLLAVKEKNHALYAVVGSAHLVGLTEEKILLEVKFRFWAERLYEKRNRALIEQLSENLTGRHRSLECQVVAQLPVAAGAVSPAEEDLVKTVVEVFEINSDG